ncbi:MAG: MFS transporter, partial [Rhodospirillales bacterium]|nr:MFS transporter [Rhodospirillales bacterium]
SLTGITDFSLYFGVAMILGTGRTFANPTSNAILPNLVARKHFGNAVAWSSSGFQVTRIAGPAAGGLLLILGADVDFAVITALFVLAAFFTLGIRGKTQSARRDPVTLESLFAGFKFIWSEKIILAVISIDLFAVFLGGAVALLPIYAKDILQVGEWGLGILRSAPAWGAVVSAIYLTQRPIKRNGGIKMFISVGIFGLATVGFGISENFAWTLVALTIMGAADMFSVYVRQNIIQLTTPDEMRGRVNAVNSVFVGASNELGEFESGVTAEWWGTVPAVLVGGFGTLAIAAIWMKLFPSLRRVDGLDAESLARS